MPASYVPRVIVKFKNKLVDISVNDAADKFLAQLKTERAWTQLVAQRQFQGITIKKLFTAVTQPRLLNLIVNARRRDPTYRPPNFLSYFSILCPPNVNPEELVKVLSSPSWSSTVQLAYIAGTPAEDPGVNIAGNPGWELYEYETGFLRSAPKGINAEYAWTIRGGDGGKGIGVSLQFFDIESNWDLAHLDLVPANPQWSGIGYRKPQIERINHGTAVLGIVIASDSNPAEHSSSLGITPNLDVTKVFSYWRGEDDFNYADTITAASSELNFGDVLLLEFQLDFLNGHSNQPSELQDDIWQAIRLATARGIVVVEAAGNGAKDLDTWPDFYRGTDSVGNPVYFSLNRNSSHFKDSGAILVSAASSDVPHHDEEIYNFGSRIDCYAWGDSIYTTLSTDPYGTAGGTSGAAAIIAGAALSLQGIAAARPNGCRLSPLQIRQLLSDPITGTLIGYNLVPPHLPPHPPLPSDWNIKKLGVMPDLEAIIKTSVGLTPCNHFPDVTVDWETFGAFIWP